MTALLDVRDLTVEYAHGRGRTPVRAVDGLSLQLRAGETVGIVGESGSGKSTLGKAILGLVPVTEGTVAFDGTDITWASSSLRRRLSADLQVIFQDPYSSLNPVRTIGQTLAEPALAHRRATGRGADRNVAAILERVGLAPDAAGRYPAAFSSGQRQRIAIARALMLSPRLVICDEPVSALDLSIQAQVLNLLRDLQDELGVSYLFISHNLTVVRHMAHRVVVMYRGRVMEEGDANTVAGCPAHPYTEALADAEPVPDPAAQRIRREHRRSMPPRLTKTEQDGPAGCPYAARCPLVIDICRAERPALLPSPSGSATACHRRRATANAATTDGTDLTLT